MLSRALSTAPWKLRRKAAPFPISAVADPLPAVGRGEGVDDAGQRGGVLTGSGRGIGAEHVPVPVGEQLVAQGADLVRGPVVRLLREVELVQGVPEPVEGGRQVRGEGGARRRAARRADDVGRRGRRFLAQRPERPRRPGDEARLVHFDCGRESLNGWLRRHAWVNQVSGVSRVNVIADAASGRIVGYVTLNAAQIERAFLLLGHQGEAAQPLQIPGPVAVHLSEEAAVDLIDDLQVMVGSSGPDGRGRRDGWDYAIILPECPGGASSVAQRGLCTCSHGQEG
jgi:hypothetical protein